MSDDARYECKTEISGICFNSEGRIGEEKTLCSCTQSAPKREKEDRTKNDSVNLAKARKYAKKKRNTLIETLKLLLKKTAVVAAAAGGDEGEEPEEICMFVCAVADSRAENCRSIRETVRGSSFNKEGKCRQRLFRPRHKAEIIIKSKEEGEQEECKRPKARIPRNEAS